MLVLVSSKKIKRNKNSNKNRKRHNDKRLSKAQQQISCVGSTQTDEIVGGAQMETNTDEEISSNCECGESMRVRKRKIDLG